jgi:hypothetical protein
MHPNISPQRPIAPKSTNIPTNPIVSPPSFHSSSIQPIQKNFQCRVCHLTYKVIFTTDEFLPLNVLFFLEFS